MPPFGDGAANLISPVTSAKLGQNLRAGTLILISIKSMSQLRRKCLNNVAMKFGKKTVGNIITLKKDNNKL